MFLVNCDVIYYVEMSSGTNIVILILGFILISVFFLPYLIWVGAYHFIQRLEGGKVYLSRYMTQQLKAFAAFLEDPTLVPDIHFRRLNFM